MSFKENSKFVLLEDQESKDNDGELNEFHYKGGIKMQKIRIGGGGIEKNEYREHDNKVVPFSLAYHDDEMQERYNKYKGGKDIEVVPDDLYDKLFFSVANEVNKNNNRKTLKKLK